MKLEYIHIYLSVFTVHCNRLSLLVHEQVRYSCNARSTCIPRGGLEITVFTPTGVAVVPGVHHVVKMFKVCRHAAKFEDWGAYTGVVSGVYG